MKTSMKSIMILLLFPALAFAQSGAVDASTILERIDDNMSSDNRVLVSDMVIHGRRKSRTVSSKSYGEGRKRSMTEYLAPEREEGTKMLKLEDRLWIYSPSSDRTIQISGHMLKQSVMGSDLSYEDMMDDRKLTDIYDAKVISEESYEERPCWIVEMNAKVEDAAYEKRKVWGGSGALRSPQGGVVCQKWTVTGKRPALAISAKWMGVGSL